MEMPNPVVETNEVVYATVLILFILCPRSLTISKQKAPEMGLIHGLVSIQSAQKCSSA